MDGPTDVDSLAEALRQDGVVVDRVMGSGAAQESHDRIAALVRETPFPVYVALVEQPKGLPDDAIDATEALAGLLNRRLGDGLYVLDTTEGIQQVFAYGLDTNPSRLSLGAGRNDDALDEAMQEVGGYRIGTQDYLYPPAVAEAEAQVLAAEDLVEMAREPSGDDYPVTLEETEVEDLARYAVRVAATADWRPTSEEYVSVRTAASGLSALVGGLGGLVVALLVGQSLRGWPRRGAPRRAVAPTAEKAATYAVAPPDLEDERKRAVRLADALTRSLEKTDWETLRDRDVAARALTARDAVEPLLASGDIGDVIGARTIAQMGAHDLGRGRRGSGAALVPCFFDPRHPDGTATASWRLGDGTVEVPCCPACATAVGQGATPRHLRLPHRLPHRRGTVPYWERDDVWARTGFGAITDDLAGDVLAERVGEP
ncbi:hypothetical protein [Nocardioides sp. zg-1228]|uniref:hypothetical protein n=1 Tax=Nocardioides sp. zg-1228 TaxID=2763008 RepID=UPI001642E86A|nr:hypothetical protein [Nocardioides sp. zg-1228]MBC2932987.1 hypothetical protein [Nocardioides sp. zg-1228]QSF56815.1 hypothetical protein JX575_14585 [Nocardioides sp. zg-1228]